MARPFTCPPLAESGQKAGGRLALRCPQSRGAWSEGRRAGGGARGSGPVARGRRATLFPDPSRLPPSKSPSWGPLSLPVWLALETLFLAPSSPVLCFPLLGAGPPKPRGYEFRMQRALWAAAPPISRKPGPQEARGKCKAGPCLGSRVPFQGGDPRSSGSSACWFIWLYGGSSSGGWTIRFQRYSPGCSSPSSQRFHLPAGVVQLEHLGVPTPSPHFYPKQSSATRNPRPANHTWALPCPEKSFDS